MALNLDPKVVSHIVDVVEKRADGATLNDIISAFPKAPPRRTANRWVSVLVDAGTLRADTSGMPHRYFVGADGAPAAGVANSPVSVAKSMANSSGMANSPATMARSATPDDPMANCPVVGHSVAKSAEMAKSMANSSGTANSPAGVAKSALPDAGMANSPEVGGLVAKSPPLANSGTPVAKSAVPVADTAHKPARKRGKPAHASDLATEESMAELAKSAIETVVGTPTPATAGHRPEPVGGLVANSVAKSASQAVANLLAKSIDPLVPANLRPMVRVAALFAGAMIAIGILAQASIHPWIATGVAVAVLAGIVIFALFRQKSAADAEPPVANSPEIAKSVANSPGSVAKSASAAEIVAKSPDVGDPMAKSPGMAKSSKVTECRTAGGSASDPDSTFSVSALADVASGSVQRVSVSGNEVPATPTLRTSDAAAATPARPRRRRVTYLVGGLALLAIATAGTIWYLRTPPKPTKADVSACLTTYLAPLPVRVAAIDLTFLRAGSSGCEFRYDAQIVATAPLYQRLNTAEYLHAIAATEMAVIEATEKEQGAGGKEQGLGTSDQGLWASRIAAIGPVPTPALNDLVLVKVQTPPGKSAHIDGTMEAFWSNGAWSYRFTDGKEHIDAGSIAGIAKPANALAVDQPADLARLKVLIADHAAYAAKVRAAAAALAADLERERVQAAATLERERQQKAADLERENQQKAADLERERQQKLTALKQVFQRGTFLRGVFVDDTQQAKHPVLLEVTDCSATTHQITLLLRSTSGWYKTRTGQGDWSIEADGETGKAKVRFSSLDRIPGAGAPLDDTSSFFLTLRVYPDGTVAADPITWELQHVAAENVAATKAEFGYRDPRVAEQGAGSKNQGLGGAGAPSGRTEGQKIGGSGAASSPSGGSVDRRPGGSASVPPIDRSTVTPSSDRLLDPDSSHPDSSSAATLSPADVDFFSVCAAGTAYARVDGSWVRLPTNSAKALQSVPQKLTGVIANLSSWQDKLAGKSSATASMTEGGAIKFDGIETVPTVPANEVVIVYVGPLTPISADAKARYPELKDYPIIELAPEKMAAKGVRYATLYRLPAGLLGFGTTRVMNATIEQPSPNLTVLRSTSPVPRGRYAVACGSDSYEVRVE